MFSFLKILKKPRTQYEEYEIPRYPPFMKGVPAASVRQILDTQKELIDKIFNAAATNKEEFSSLYMSTIERFAGYVHLLPASQSHHHRGAGGLLRHSLEVGLWALQTADRMLLDIAQAPSQRREMEPRWQLAVFLAGLCHDAGKPVTDLVVTNSDRTSVWQPIQESLVSWIERSKITEYYLDWRDGRSKKHTALSSLMADRIITTDVFKWINQCNCGVELIVWMIESLASNPSPMNPIHDLVVKADQISVERDLRTLGVAMAGYELGVPVERHITDIMRRFVKEGVWLINEPGARLWKIEDYLYLVWPAAGEEIAQQVREDGIPGIPRTPDGILDMLVERQIAFVREDVAPGEDRLWKIAPAILNVTLSAVRLRDDALVSSLPIPSVTSSIVEQAPLSSLQDPIAPAPSSNDETIATTPPNTENTNTPQETNTKSKPKQKTKSTPALTTQSKPSVAEDAVEPRVILDGAVGEAFKALVQDMASGDKQWGVDVTLDENQHVLLRWPDAFSGYGLNPKSILDELSSRGWLWVDPMAPMKKITDAQFDGVFAKAIRIERDVSNELIRMIQFSETTNTSLNNTDDNQIATTNCSDCASDISLDELISAIKDLPITVQKDGSIVAEKSDIIRECRKSGLNMNYRLLSQIAKQNPEKILVDGPFLIFKI
jgi:conjugal transfer pilus assembly protein TraI